MVDCGEVGGVGGGGPLCIGGGGRVGGVTMICAVISAVISEQRTRVGGSVRMGIHRVERGQCEGRVRGEEVGKVEKGIGEGVKDGKRVSEEGQKTRKKQSGWRWKRPLFICFQPWRMAQPMRGCWGMETMGQLYQ